ncbi:MAG TPA: hypothetical protein VGT00_14395 [Methylomirabilota bacterium]|nr:hypothetical protein [Methylomirabilota bacterium]
MWRGWMLGGAGLGCLLAALLIGPPSSRAQVFLASKPQPEFSVGSLFIAASITKSLGPTPIDVQWSLVLPAKRDAADIAQDLYLLWPDAVTSPTPEGRPDPALERMIAGDGVSIVRSGRLPLGSRRVDHTGRSSTVEPMGDGAPFVTFVRKTNSGGLSNPGTLIRIPWHELLGDPARMATLRLTSSRVIRDKPQTWLDELFWGRRHTASLTFGDVRFSSLYGLYFEHRDRLIPMAGDLSQLTLRFGDADHLRLDEISPAGATSQRSQTRKETETVTLVLDKSDGLKPQLLRASFAYFDGLHAILPIAVTVAVFTLGHLGGPLVAAVFRRGAAAMARRIHIAPRRGTADHTTGVVLSKETLGRITPGETTYQQVLALCGPHNEEHEQLKMPGRRSLIYRGRRTVPHERRSFGRLATVSHWDVEQHEVVIDFEGDLVSDLQAHLRRSRAGG